MTKEYAMKEEVYTKTITKVKLCKATNLSYPTIRCWMEKGLLTPKRNENNNYYNFNVLDIMSIHNIIFSRNINLTLAEAKNLTKLSRQEFVQLFEKKKEQVKRKIEEYQEKLKYIENYCDMTAEYFNTGYADFTIVTPRFKHIVEADIYIDEHIRLLALEPIDFAILFDGDNMSDETASSGILLHEKPKKGKILTTVNKGDRYLVKTVTADNRNYNEELFRSACEYAEKHGYGKVNNMIYLLKFHNFEDGKDLFTMDVYFKLS